jgi:hypothetical protein
MACHSGKSTLRPVVSFLHGTERLTVRILRLHSSFFHLFPDHITMKVFLQKNGLRFSKSTLRLVVCLLRGM